MGDHRSRPPGLFGQASLSLPSSKWRYGLPGLPCQTSPAWPVSGVSFFQSQGTQVNTTILEFHPILPHLVPLAGTPSRGTTTTRCHATSLPKAWWVERLLHSTMTMTSVALAMVTAIVALAASQRLRQLYARQRPCKHYQICRGLLMEVEVDPSDPHSISSRGFRGAGATAAANTPRVAEIHDFSLEPLSASIPMPMVGKVAANRRSDRWLFLRELELFWCRKFDWGTPFCHLATTVLIF